MIRVTVWNEYSEGQQKGPVKEVYPDGLHVEIADFLNKAGFDARTAILTQPEHGLTEEALNNTDVLVWWGHCQHHLVTEDVANRVVAHVNRGMGIILLHSAHNSKPFKKLMGTTCSLLWREAGEKERVWVVEKSHPIAKGLPESFVIEHEEMYGERFDIPTPEQVVLLGWFQGGEVFRTGVTYTRGLGKVFYFQPGHETYPTYKNKTVQQVIINAVSWAAPEVRADVVECTQVSPLEPLK